MRHAFPIPVIALLACHLYLQHLRSEHPDDTIPTPAPTADHAAAPNPQPRR